VTPHKKNTQGMICLNNRFCQLHAHSILHAIQI
jgi:hypothetical protein